MAAPHPLLVEAAGHTCVAWWHPPAVASQAGARPGLPAGWVEGEQGALPMAVVLASSWGEEDLSGYDGQRALAQALAAGGLGTLRLEWPDTGDSSAVTGEVPLAGLLAALDAGADQARALSGAGRLAFVGLRLGALLAVHAAQARDDVHAFVGLLPVAGGRAFVREQRLLGAAFAPPAGAASADSAATVMLGGFAVPAARADEIAALEWPAVGPGASSLREALLLAAPGQPARAAADALARLGARVTGSEWRDLDRLLAIAHQAELAPLAIAEVVRWLQARAADEGAAPVRPCAPVPAREGWMTLAVAGTAVRERIEALPQRPSAGDPVLVGVLAERATTEPAPAGGRRGVVLLSSGRERRVGPHRLWVPFARQRAARGDVVLRLDIAGVGDSARRARPDPGGTPELYDPRCVEDVARAIEHLRQAHGVGPCTVMGLCSGAYHAWRAALAGLDVQQVVAINPLVFHWRPGMSLDPQAQAFGQIAIAAGAGRSLLDPARWWKLLSGRAHVGVIAGALAGRARHALRLRGRALGRLLGVRLQDDLAAELAQAAARGVALDFVFSRDDPGRVLLREEAGRAGMRLERDKRLQVCEVAHADHTFAGTRGRAGLYARLDCLLQPASPMPPVPSATLPPLPAAARS